MTEHDTSFPSKSPGMRASLIVAAVVLAVTAVVPPALAHHSFAAQFDADRPVTLEGAVTKVEWQNPHVWIYLDVTRPDGQVAAWECEGDNPNTLTRMGWTGQSLQIGDPITIHGYQARNGRNVCNGRTWVFGGRTLFAGANDGGPRAAPPQDR